MCGVSSVLRDLVGGSVFPIREGCDSNSAPGLTCMVSIIHLHVNLVG